MESISIAEFIDAIRLLPADPPEPTPGVWYDTQKEHWLGWLGWLADYNGPGYYGRKTSRRRDARYAYNHIVNWQMLEWLIRAAGADETTNQAVRAASKHGTLMQDKAAAIRRVVPWDRVAALLWGEQINGTGGKTAPSSGRRRLKPR